MFDTSINLVQDPDFSQYPVKLNVDIQLVVLFQSGVATQTTSKGIGSIEEAPGKCLHVIASNNMVEYFLLCIIALLYPP